MSKIALITGASSGIGEAIALKLAQEGNSVVLGARRLDRLLQLQERIQQQGGKALAMACDVTRCEDLEKLAQTALDQFGRIDILVNNAGIMPLSFLAHDKVVDWDRMIDVNIKGVLYGIHAVLPTMTAQKSGHIINLASVAGHVVTPSAAVYSATKFAVRAITEGLRQENRGFLRTTVICPGAVTSELTQSISDEKIAKGIGALYQDAIDADAIANAVSYAVAQPEDVDVNELIIRPTKQKL